VQQSNARAAKAFRALLRRRVALVLGAVLVLVSDPAWATAAAPAPPRQPDHSDPFAPVVLGLAFVMAIAMLGRWLAGRFRQPSVLGELSIGLVVGNIGHWLGFPVFILITHLGDVRSIFREVWLSGESVAVSTARVLGPASFEAGGRGAELVPLLTGPDALPLVYLSFGFSLFSVLGLLILAFMIGLQSSITEMRRVGASASRVAAVGVIVPFALGLLLCTWLLHDDGLPTHLFVAATLCATSVGITARVFQDLGNVRSAEARVILGAAVIDDVLGLLLLSVVAGIAATGAVDGLEVLRLSLLATTFLGLVFVFGERIARRAAHVFEGLDRQQGKLIFPLVLAFTLAWFANRVELAAIVGAFAAGLIVSEDYFVEESHGWKIEDLVAPLEAVFAPVFFVVMGMQVNLASLAEPATLGLAGAFTAVAIVGKLAAGLPAGPGVDRLTVGLGMIPRGEVGLIFASIGKTIGVVNDAVFSAIVVMVMVTTFVTPVALRWSMARADGKDQPGAPAQE
jgi:Kef-type K+ transport system membrane component KefB